MNPQPVTLTGRFVRLEPLGPRHFEALAEVGANRGIFQFFPIQVESPAEVLAYLSYCVAQMQSGDGVTFTIISLTDEKPVGGTSFLAIDRVHKRLEIGGTWISPDWQRTACNTEAKYLQLRHCFEDLGCVRVEFKTDSMNGKSRAALSRIGAVEEGTFRNHMIVQPSGRHRHSVYFGIIDSEWPNVKALLKAKLGQSQHIR
jgi:RimJ/RimL family protein N-acetyltransferase